METKAQKYRSNILIPRANFSTSIYENLQTIYGSSNTGFKSEGMAGCLSKVKGTKKFPLEKVGWVSAGVGTSAKQGTIHRT